MNDLNPTTRQLIIFSVLMSFIVAVIGTVLALGVFAPLFGVGESGIGGPVQINKPGILERIKETVVKTETEVSERVLRQDELVVKVVEAASPAVVNIVATKDVPIIERFFIDPFADDPFFRDFLDEGSGFQIPQFRQKGTEKKEVSSGTGFLVSADGLVITNKHVVADTEAEYTALFNDGKKMSAKVLARDPVQDIAILRVEGSDFAYLALGDSQGVKIGQTVIAIGNALGEFRNTVSVGVVSGLQRSIIARDPSGSSEALQELIQTDAAINPGNSGGPLISLYGEVVGINTAIAQGAQSIGFAIPVNKAKRDLDNVRAHGRIIYPFLGVRYSIITKERAEKEKLGRDSGVLLISGNGEPAVVAGSPAEKAGLKEGDIILELQGEKVTAENSLASLIQKNQVGQEILLKVFRKGASPEEFEARTVLIERK